MIDYGPAPRLDGKLTPKDYPKDVSVTITLQDGSTCRFQNSFYHREGDWIAVYSEQVGCYMFNLSVLSSIKGPSREIGDRYALL